MPSKTKVAQPKTGRPKTGKVQTKQYLIKLSRLVSNVLSDQQMSQNRFAEFSGLPQATISQIINAANEVNPRNLKLLAIALYKLTGRRYTRDALYEIIYEDELPYPWLKDQQKDGIDNDTRDGTLFELESRSYLYARMSLEPSPEGVREFSKILQNAIAREDLTLQDLAVDENIDIPVDRLAMLLTGLIQYAPDRFELDKLKNFPGGLKRGRKILSFNDLMALIYPDDDDNQPSEADTPKGNGKPIKA